MNQIRWRTKFHPSYRPPTRDGSPHPISQPARSSTLPNEAPSSSSFSNQTSFPTPSNNPHVIPFKNYPSKPTHAGPPLPPQPPTKQHPLNNPHNVPNRLLHPYILLPHLDPRRRPVLHGHGLRQLPHSSKRRALARPGNTDDDNDNDGAGGGGSFRAISGLSSV
jgi:hypothetical protein